MLASQFGGCGVWTGSCALPLRQLHTVLRSLTSYAAVTLIYAFISARLDCCSSLCAGLPVWRLWCLDRVLRTAARFSSRTPNLAIFPAIGPMLDVLHWLPLQQRIYSRIISLVWRSLLGLAPAYLRDLCCTTLGVSGGRSLRSTERGLLILLRSNSRALLPANN